jgi:hypothetical protein
VTVYTKPHLAFADQVGLLKSRGLIIDDEAEAERLLSVIGYYRLSGYWYSFRRPLDGALRDDHFLEGTTFAQVVRLYDVDRRSKLQLLDALERDRGAVGRSRSARARQRGRVGQLAASAQLRPQRLRPSPPPVEQESCRSARSEPSAADSRSTSSDRSSGIAFPDLLDVVRRRILAVSLRARIQLGSASRRSDQRGDRGMQARASRVGISGRMGR